VKENGSVNLQDVSSPCESCGIHKVPPKPQKIILGVGGVRSPPETLQKIADVTRTEKEVALSSPYVVDDRVAQHSSSSLSSLMAESPNR
jgi:hypothetical protein